MYRQLSAGSILAVSTLLAGLVSAQTAPTLPTCATSCVTQSLPANCNLDPSCICTSESFLQGIACCVFEACDPSDQQAALAYAHSICDPVGGSTLLPASAGCPSTASGNSTTSATGSATGAASTAASNSATTTSAESSASHSASSAASSASESASSGASAASTTPSGTPGAGSRMGVGLGAVGAGLLGLAAVL